MPLILLQTTEKAASDAQVSLGEPLYHESQHAVIIKLQMELNEVRSQSAQVQPCWLAFCGSCGLLIVCPAFSESNYASLYEDLLGGSSVPFCI